MCKDQKQFYLTFMKKIMYVICFAGIVVQSCNQHQPVTDQSVFNPIRYSFRSASFRQNSESSLPSGFPGRDKRTGSRNSGHPEKSGSSHFCQYRRGHGKIGAVVKQGILCVFHLREANTNDSSRPLQRRLCPKSRLIRTV